MLGFIFITFYFVHYCNKIIALIAVVHAILRVLYSLVVHVGGLLLLSSCCMLMMHV